ncbi:Arginine-hydroxylase NDUFAF5, mitochondrial [Vanrija pseudolonga]|uniref:Arginine-hydroxylase NDUFAF5, mitochondrial n=1 Tax=Vanrija pseudolonga TaxID=143232 RepID=A0AAF1BES7_9TREE|nr:Arginine-hydroxylase NDUFAF5, mitochondrial [Vanrija pseudolonga]
MSLARGVTAAARRTLATTRTTAFPAFRAAAVRAPRTYATLSPHTPPPTTAYDVFDESAKAAQRDRAVARIAEAVDAGEVEGPEVLDYLRDEVADRIVERVEDLKVPPATIVDLSAHAGQLTRMLQDVLGDELHPSTEGAGVLGHAKRKWIMVEQSGGALNRDADETFAYPPERIQTTVSSFLADPRLDALRDKVDCVVSSGGLHWIGDIVGAFTQIKHLLKPDGVFIGAVLGGDTLFELRTSLQLAEQERRGGIANRVSPMINTTDAPSLLNRAGFTLTTVDTDDVTINYPSMWELMQDLRDMGESNAILGRKTHVSRDVLLAAEAIYKELYGNPDGSVPATFQIIFFVGWKPSPNQPKPLARGSAQTNLKDIL